MALTVTAFGGASNGTSQTTLVCAPIGATITVGSLGVLLLAFDNSGTGGSTKIFTQATFNDSVGNTWTRRLDAIYDPGAAGAGMELAAYTSLIGTQILTTDNMTVTVSTNTVGKLARIYGITGSTGTPTHVTTVPLSDGLTSGQTGTAVTVTSSSITSGDVIIGWYGAETASATSVVDSDSTNGSWSAEGSTSLATPIRIAAQSKVTTGTGTQTYNVTLGASADWQVAWMQVTEVSTEIKTISGLVKASVNTVNGLAIASVKTVEGLA